MSGSVKFFVVGEPAPQGSKTHVGGGRMVESSKGVKPWRDSVAYTGAEMARKYGAFNGPVEVWIDFVLRMPKSRPAATRAAGIGWRPTRPDIDKLVRSTLDGLQTSGLIADDSNVVALTVVKVERTEGWTGALIRVAHTESGTRTLRLIARGLGGAPS